MDGLEIKIEQERELMREQIEGERGIAEEEPSIERLSLIHI